MGQTREEKIIKQLSNPASVQKRTAIATDMFLPNHSGDHSAGHTGTPTKDLDLANKAYVDAHAGVTDHTLLSNIGTNTHAQIDTAISNLTGDVMADSQHRHSELSASDGTPNPALYVDAAGHVGIGTTTPESTCILQLKNLDVGLEFELDTTVANGARIFCYDRAGGSYRDLQLRAAAIALWIGSTEIFKITTAKNAILNADLNAPTNLSNWANYQLTIAGGGTTGDSSGILLTTTSDNYGGSSIVHYDKGAGGTGDLVFYTKQATTAVPPVEVMRLTNLGNVGINDVAPAEKLDIDGNLNLTGVLKIDDVQVVKEQQAAIADLKVNYAAGELDTEAEIITAINTTNAKINAIILMLETHGLIAT